MGFTKGLRKIGWCLGLFLLAVVGVSLSGVAFAADEKPDYRIMASPASLDLELKPGKTTTTKFSVVNTGTKAFDFTISTAPYSVGKEDYKSDFTTETEHTDLAKWITFSEDSGSLEPSEEREITATIKVPTDVPDGGQYAVILAKMLERSEGGEQGSAVVTEKQVGILVYSKNVDGKTRLEGEIVENKVASFLFTPPIQATSVVRNNGNVHAEAKYILQVYPLFSDEEVYTNEEYPDVKKIMPDAQRFNTVTWDGAPKLGVFKVRQTVEFLGETSVTEKVVFLCPIWFLVIILVIIFMAVFWLVNRSRGRKEVE